jgi:hypothetical protein
MRSTQQPFGRWFKTVIQLERLGSIIVTIVAASHISHESLESLQRLNSSWKDFRAFFCVNLPWSYAVMRTLQQPRTSEKNEDNTLLHLSMFHMELVLGLGEFLGVAFRCRNFCLTSHAMMRFLQQPRTSEKHVKRALCCCWAWLHFFFCDFVCDFLKDPFWVEAHHGSPVLTKESCVDRSSIFKFLACCSFVPSC